MEKNNYNMPNIDVGNSKRLQFIIGIDGDITFSVCLLDKENNPIDASTNPNLFITVEDMIKAVSTTQVLNQNTLIINGLEKVKEYTKNNIPISDKDLNEFTDNDAIASLIQYDQLIAEIKRNSITTYISNKMNNYDTKSAEYRYLYRILEAIVGEENLKPDDITM